MYDLKEISILEMGIAFGLEDYKDRIKTIVDDPEFWAKFAKEFTYEQLKEENPDITFTPKQFKSFLEMIELVTSTVDVAKKYLFILDAYEKGIPLLPDHNYDNETIRNLALWERQRYIENPEIFTKAEAAK